MKTLLFFLWMIFSFTVFSQSGEGLQIGDQVPEFSAPADDGTTWEARDYIGKNNLVVYFYPAAMTGGCTAQACAYRDLSTNLTAEDAVVLGVSGDNTEGLRVFKQAHNLNFTLLSDESGEIVRDRKSVV